MVVFGPKFGGRYCLNEGRLELELDGLSVEPGGMLLLNRVCRSVRFSRIPTETIINSESAAELVKFAAWSRVPVYREILRQPSNLFGASAVNTNSSCTCR